MSRYRLNAGILILSFCASLLVFGQTNPNLEAGLKPFGMYQGSEFDSVSLTNGNLTLQIPLIDVPQRGGVKIGYELVYNHKGFSVVEHCQLNNPDICTFQWLWSAGTVYTGPDGLAIVESHNFSVIPVKIGTNNYTYSIRTADGATHQLDKISGTTNQYEAIDGSGFKFTGDYTGGTVLDRNGMIPGWEDTNGNHASSVSAGVVTDTMGRTLSTNQTASDTTGCRTDLRTPVGAYTLTFPGPAGSSGRVMKVCSVSVKMHTDFQYTACDTSGTCGPAAEYVGTQTLIQQVIVYDGNSWTTSPSWSFRYDDAYTKSDGTVINYGDLTRVILPTGGSISYTWATYSLCTIGTALTQESRGVVSRTIATLDGQTGNQYSYQFNHLESDGPIHTIVNNPDGSWSDHTITGFGCSLYDTKVQSYDASGTLLKTVQTDYQYKSNPYDQWGDGTPTAMNVFPIRVTTTWPNGQMTKTETDYDNNLQVVLGGPTISYGNPIAQREYDYYTGGTWPLLRQTLTSYQAFSNSNYLNANLIGLPSTVTVEDGSNNQVAQTTYGYDESTLASSNITTQRDTSVPNPGTRGNTTSVKKWLSTGGVLTTSTVYYDTGMPYSVTDPKLNTTTYSYDPSYIGAYLTKTQMPDTSSPNLAHHSVSAAYDFNTGWITTFSDQNSQSSTYAYDLLGRFTSASFPDQGQNTFDYPSLVEIERKRKINSSTWDDYVMLFDGLGRTSQTQMSDPEGTVYTLVNYDNMGRKSQSFNPTRCSSVTSNCAGESTWGYTTYNYDGLGRTKSVIEQDGSSVVTDYSAFPCVTVTDEAGHPRKSCSDGLGRIATVWEPDPNNSASFLYETDYQYDALGNLLRVDQKGSAPTDSSKWRTRTFTYDSLSRLLCAQNPEIGNSTAICPTTVNGIYPSGIIRYFYDNDGNVTSKISPAPNQPLTGTYTITTSYTYDALNRLTYENFSDGTYRGQYSYDESTSAFNNPVANGIGRLTSTWEAYGGKDYSYDAMGRVTTTNEVINSNTVNKSFKTQYTFDLAGDITALLYPSGRQLNYQYGVAGRPTLLTDSNGARYATTLTYWPNGAWDKWLTQYTTPRLFAETTLNNRLQVSALNANDTACHNYVNKAYGYGSQNNGNILTIVNNNDVNRTQTFTYDALNRIQSAYTQGATGQNAWGDNFTIDAWGNMSSAQMPGRPNGDTIPSVSLTNWDGHNRMNSASVQYDPAGNLTNDGTYSYTYDAGNMLKSDQNYTYLYDSTGMRFQKWQNGAGVKGYVYGSGTEPLVETNGAGNATAEYVYLNGQRIARIDADHSVHYYLSDHLGSTSMVVNAATANVEEESDFRPYGFEVVITGPTSNRYKFTSKERDAETGMDYFGARYHGAVMGRWSSPDWSSSPEPVPWAVLENPQSLNLFAYVLNSPMSRFDSSGHEPGDDPCKKDPDHCINVTAPLSSIPLILLAYGHHGLSNWSKIQAGTDAYKFFQMWRTGKLVDPSANYYDWLHRLYNQAVGEELEQFLASKGKNSIEELTTEECKELARKILSSRAPGIANFLERLEATNAGAVAILKGLANGSTEVSIPVVMPKAELNHILCGEWDCTGHNQMY